MSDIYNVLKLSEYRALFRPLRVLVVGSGAVGTYAMELLSKLGVSPDALDFDCFTLENAAKHSCLVRTPDDGGRNKAICVSERVQPLLDDECSSNGIDGELCKLGPEAFANYNYVLAALDNFDAKILLNELIRQLPSERRPIMITCGTYDESAESIILDNIEFCGRCLIDEAWMKDSSIKTSCAAPQIRTRDGVPVIVRTSNMASSMAAHLAVEQLRADVICKHTRAAEVVNHRVSYTAYPNLEISISRPMRKKKCPGCDIHAPKKIEWLHGSVLEMKLKDALRQIGDILRTTDFELSVHRLSFSKVVHVGFITDDVCYSCGKPIHVMQHVGRVFADDMLCKDCASAGKHAGSGSMFTHNKPLGAFNSSCADELKEMSLYELGYPLGAHIEVIRRNEAIDLLDSDKIEYYVFACDEDHLKMHDVKKL